MKTALPAAEITSEAATVATEAQLPMIVKLVGLGWRVVNISGRGGVAGRVICGTATITFAGKAGARGELSTDGNFKRR